MAAICIFRVLYDSHLLLYKSHEADLGIAQSPLFVLHIQPREVNGKLGFKHMQFVPFQP